MQIDFYTDPEKNKKALEDIKKNLINKTIKLKIYKIDYTYKTKRGNKKMFHKYFMSAIEKDETDIRFEFIEFINSYNTTFPNKPYLNVKILKCGYMGDIEKSIF